SGTFTYTVNPASVAGNDSFVIQVRDAGFHLISVSPTKTQVPVLITVGANGLAAEQTSQKSARISTALAVTAAAVTGTIYQVVTSG
ncbi:hypothetical protein C6A85_42930, partial [Mycobacterium sp. ITM-2017-0098]